MNPDNFFHDVVNDTSDVSTPEVNLTEHEKAIAWAEFEAYMRELETENNYKTYK